MKLRFGTEPIVLPYPVAALARELVTTRPHPFNLVTSDDPGSVDMYQSAGSGQSSRSTNHRLYHRSMSESPAREFTMDPPLRQVTRKEPERGLMRAVTLTISGGILLVGSLTVAGLVLLGFPGIKHQAKVPISTYFDILKLSFGAIAGIGAAAALVMTYRRQLVAEAASRRDDQAANWIMPRRRGNGSGSSTNDLLPHLSNSATSNLPSALPASTPWPDSRTRPTQRQTCIDVLCAYLRMPYPPMPNENRPDNDRVTWTANARYAIQ